MDEHGNESISAVVVDGFLAGDDEDEDYEDLYNDVNVGENFFHSVNKSDDVAVESREDEQRPVPPLPPQTVAVEEVKLERSGEGGGGGGDSRASDRVEEVQKSEDRSDDIVPVPPGGGAMRINFGQQVEQHPTVNMNTDPSNPVTAGNVVNVGNGGGFARPGPNVNGNAFGSGGGSTMLFVGDLHWWTTDAELEVELCKYGAVKEVRFFDEKASGKSKGYAQVEFFDPASAATCKDNMNGHIFNGRACVVAFASPFSIKRMGEAQMNRTTQQAAAQGGGGGALGPVRRGPVDGPSANITNKPSLGGSYQGGGENINNNNRGYQGGGDNIRGGYGRGNWGRGNGQGMGGRGPTGPIRNRPGGMMGRGMMGSGFGAGPPMLPPQAMMGQGFDPTFGAPMGRMGGYGGFPGGPTPPFSGMMPSFPPVVAPHVNPAFFGRGMGMHGMGMMSASGVEGNTMGMWSDPNMAQWGSEEHGGRVAESSYAEEEVSDRQYKEGSRDRGAGRPNAMKEKDRGEREWSGSSDKRYKDDKEAEYEREMPREKGVSHDHERQERRHRDERDVSRERERERDYEQPRARPHDHDKGRDRHRDERERYVDHYRYKDREPEYDDEWDRGRSSRTHSKEGQHYRSRDVDYSKRRRLMSE